jgi:hypothetical protein
MRIALSALRGVGDVTTEPVAEVTRELGGRLPSAVVHVRRPITSEEHAALPLWFREFVPVYPAGAGRRIELPREWRTIAG